MPLDLISPRFYTGLIFSAVTVQIRAFFKDMGDRLQHHDFLVGNNFSAADLAFASMAALVLLPEQYGAGTAPLKRVMDLELVLELRAMPAGRHAMEMYRRYRRPGARHLSLGEGAFVPPPSKL